MTTAQVETFFKEYVQAFTDQDVDKVCSSWAYPAFMVSEGRQMTLDSEAFRSLVVRLCTSYTRQGMKRAEKELLDLVPLTETTAVARTRDVLYDSDGEIVAKWEHAYLLSDTDEGIKVAAAMPDGEHPA
jgi:hypothetical protein